MSRAGQFRFPKGRKLQSLLQLKRKVQLEDLFTQTLTHPLESLFERPKKNIRSQLVQLGFRLAGNNSENVLDRCREILEMLHAGSLVVDDIEDSSSERRGSPSLHTTYGVPLALNAGNWLYFLPLTYIETLPVPENRRTALLRECSRTLLLAHYGQALDVGVPVQSLPQSRVADVVLSAMELKTGVLAGFALRIGGILSGAHSKKVRALDVAGRKLGIALQMFDDIGNLTSSRNPHKRAEDIKLNRLSFVTAVAAEQLPVWAYMTFLDLGKTYANDQDAIQRWLEERDVLASARRWAEKHLDEAIAHFKRFHLGPKERAQLDTLCQQLKESYD